MADSMISRLPNEFSLDVNCNDCEHYDDAEYDCNNSKSVFFGITVDGIVSECNLFKKRA